jgi:hypothetical protein
MSEYRGVFVPAKPYDESVQTNPLARFEPGTRVLPVGFQVGERYQPPQHELVLEKDTAVQLV